MGSHRGSVFNFNRFASPVDRVVRVRSDSVDLQVKPVPESFTGRVWLPARSLRLEEAWSLNPEKLISGEPVTHSIRTSVVGLNASLLPVMEQSLPDSLRAYPDQPVFDQQEKNGRIYSSRIDKAAIIPSAAGDYLLPAVKLHWWNTETDNAESLNCQRVESAYCPVQVIRRIHPRIVHSHQQQSLR